MVVEFSSIINSLFEVENNKLEFEFAQAHCKLSPIPSPLIQHHQITLQRNVVGHTVTGSQAVSASWHTGGEGLPDTRSNGLFIRPAKEIDIDPAQQSDPVSIKPFGIDDRFDRVLEGMLGIDAHILDQVLHDEFQIPTGMQEIGTSRRMGHLRHPLMPGENKLSEILRADQSGGTEAHVIAAPDDLDTLELQELGQDVHIDLDQTVRDGFHQLAILKKSDTQRLVAHQPVDVFREVGKSPAADDTHVVREVLFIPLQRPGGSLGGIGPGVSLELLPGGDGTAVLVDETTSAASREQCGVLGDLAGEGHIDSLHTAANKIIPKEGLNRDLPFFVVKGIFTVQSVFKPKPFANSGLDFLIEEELDIVHTRGGFLTAKTTQEFLIIRRDRFRKKGFQGRASFETGRDGVRQEERITLSTVGWRGVTGIPPNPNRFDFQRHCERLAGVWANGSQRVISGPPLDNGRRK